MARAEQAESAMLQAMHRVGEAEGAMEQAEDAMLSERMRANQAEAALSASRERVVKDDSDKLKLIEALKREREKVMKVQEAYWQEVEAMQTKERDWNKQKESSSQQVSTLSEEYFRMERSMKNMRMELEAAAKAKIELNNELAVTKSLLAQASGQGEIKALTARELVDDAVLLRAKQFGQTATVDKEIRERQAEELSLTLADLEHEKGVTRRLAQQAAEQKAEIAKEMKACQQIQRQFDDQRLECDALRGELSLLQAQARMTGLPPPEKRPVPVYFVSFREPIGGEEEVIEGALGAFRRFGGGHPLDSSALSAAVLVAASLCARPGSPQAIITIYGRITLDSTPSALDQAPRKPLLPYMDV